MMLLHKGTAPKRRQKIITVSQASDAAYTVVTSFARWATSVAEERLPRLLEISGAE